MMLRGESMRKRDAPVKDAGRLHSTPANQTGLDSAGVAGLPGIRTQDQEHLGRKHTMVSRTLPRGLLAVVTALVLVGAAGRAAGQAVDTTTACFDITTNGSDITHILIDSGCGPSLSPSDFAITVDGEPTLPLHTEGGPCPDVPRDVWFRLPDKQDTAFVCVTIQADCPGLQVYAEVQC